jgi:hypothetical protein
MPFAYVRHEVEVTLRLTVSQLVCRGAEPTLGLVTRYYFLSKSCYIYKVSFSPGSEQQIMLYSLHSVQTTTVVQTLERS